MTDDATILAVDDTPEVLSLLVRILTKAGYRVQSADNGATALASVLDNPPDLILLDVRMHVMGGLEVCQILKSTEATRQIPVILVSAFADVKEWVEGLRLGAADYITKPFQPDELLSRVRTHLALRRATLSLDQQSNLVRQTNERLQIEIQERLHVENELRRSLADAEQARRAMVGALEDHQRATEALRRSEEKFRSLFESSSDAIMTLQPPDWAFSSANGATLAMFRAQSTEEFFTLRIEDLSPKFQNDGQLSRDRAKALLDKTLNEGSAVFDWVHQRLDGEIFPATVGLTRMGWGGRQFVQATVRDISVNKRLETELAHAHKLEAVGQLAAGIAHEINTPTQYVGDGLHFLKSSFASYQRLIAQYTRVVESCVREDERATVLATLHQAETEADLAYLEENIPGSIERCIDGVSRIATIVQALKEFAHPDQREMSAVDLNQALRNALTIAKNEYKYVADVELALGQLPPVVCHVNDLSQVFLNLIVNAAHAIADTVAQRGVRGQISVRTSQQGDWVQIEITDTGPGIPVPIRHRIFEPFFTTKEVGKGSGQGLAIARAIVVVKHHGSLTFQSIEGVGTTFTIRLPIDGTGPQQASSA